MSNEAATDTDAVGHTRAVETLADDAIQQGSALVAERGVEVRVRQEHVAGRLGLRLCDSCQ